MKKLVLVDGNNLIFRSYYATAYQGRLMHTSNGMPTNAIYGLSNMINKIITDESPDYMVVAFDKGKTFRHEKYEDYKAGRNKTPEELIVQFPYAKKLLKHMGITCLEIDNYEADDIIGTLSREADKTDYFQTVIVSSDNDLLQLITDKTCVNLITKGTTVCLTPELLKEHKGVYPDQIKDLKGLEGDSSDNIKGVKGVGNKTALKLIEEYGSLEAIYENIDNIKGKLKEKLENDKESAFESKDLATIYTEVPIDLDLEKYNISDNNYEELITLLTELEFKGMIKKFLAERESKEGSLGEQKSDIIVDSDEKINSELFVSPCAINIEIDELNYHKGQIKGLSITNINGTYFLLPELLKNPKIVSFLEGETEKYIFDLKRQVTALKYKGISLNNITFDVMLAEYIIDPSASSDIAYVANKYLESIKLYEEFYGKGKKKNEYTIQELADYSNSKSKFIFLIKQEVEEKLTQNDQLNLLTQIEVPLAKVLADMEYEGVVIDSDILSTMGENMVGKIEELEKEIHEIAGTEFKISSPKQLGIVLFEKMGLPVIKKTKTGYSTARDVLDKLKPHSSIIDKIIKYRTLSKLHSTYVDGLILQTYEDGRIHTIYNQALTQTGRLSSTDPNIQNIPIRDEEGRQIRKAFIPSPGCVFVGADYSQIELRVLAHLSGANNLIEAFKNGEDIHTITAMEIFEVPKEEVTSNMRRSAKAVNFGIVYGISSFGLSENLDIDFNKADEYIKAYSKKFPGIMKYTDKCIEDARSLGYSSTIMNRKRYINNINSKNVMERKFAERTAMNTPVQGSAADIIKKAMIDIDNELKKRKLESKLIIQVHDELIIDCKDEELEEVQSLLIELMEKAVELNVPLKVDCSSGRNWYETK